MTETTVTPTPESPRCGKSRWQWAQGAILGALIGIGLTELSPLPSREYFVLLAAAVGAVLAMCQFGRRLLWFGAGAVALLYCLVAYTPIVRPLILSLERRDVPASAPAVIVLGSRVNTDGNLGADTQERFLAGYKVLRAGLASRLVITDPAQDPGTLHWNAAVEAQMRQLGLNYPIDLAGPVVNTHDEAVATAKLARERGWTQVVLVTHPWHMKRAAAAFEKAGLHVICTPCNEGHFDLSTLTLPTDRVNAFRIWLRETVGYRVYQWRGWV